MPALELSKDYTTAAFRLYSAIGEPPVHITEEEVRKAIQSGQSSAYSLDMYAAARTIKTLIDSDREDIAAAVKAIYFNTSDTTTRKNLIVTSKQYAQKNGLTAQKVFRQLKEARKLFCTLRGITFESAYGKTL